MWNVWLALIEPDGKRVSGLTGMLAWFGTEIGDGI